jgi:hypothetical protein
MEKKNGKHKTKFVLPKYRKNDTVKTKDGEGQITAISQEGSYGFWYNINNKWYSEVEIIQ